MKKFEQDRFRELLDMDRFRGEDSIHKSEGFLGLDRVNEVMGLVDFAMDNGLFRVEGVAPPISKFGISLYEHESPLGYRVDLASFRSQLSEVILNVHNPLLEILSDLNARPARLKPESVPVSPSVIRRWDGNSGGLAAVVHEDFLQLQGIPWAEPSEIVNLVSLVLCLRNDGTNGGETTVFDYVPSYEDYQNATYRDNYGFNKEFVEGRSNVRTRLLPGDILVLPSRFLHSVDANTNGTRITMSTFVGTLPSGEIIYWA